jgi:hypothetical protein
MASKYMVDENLRFYTEYCALYNHTRRLVWDPEEKAKDAWELLLGSGTLKRLLPLEIELIHDIKHSMHTTKLFK